jgi:hypothetical protein
LNAANLGCGEGPDDVYEYAAVVSLESPSGGVANTGCAAVPNGVVAAGVFNCYTNAVFGNLPSLSDGGALPDGGTANFKVRVFLYNYDTFRDLTFKNSMGMELRGAAALTAAVTTSDLPDADTLCGPKLRPTWQTSCTASEQGNIAVNALCGSLVPGDAGADAGATDSGGDARVKDSGKEGAPDAGHDATLDAPTDGADTSLPGDASPG